MKNVCLEHKNELERKLKDIKNKAFGLHTHLSEYVCDASGKVCESKVKALIQELSRIRMRNSWKYQYYGISGASKRCYEALLYLIIMSHSSVDEIKTFADALAVVDELSEGYKTLTALREDEESTILIRPKGFFGTLYENYMELIGHSILDDVTDEMDIIEAEELRNVAKEEFNESMKEVCDAYENESVYAWFPDREPSIWDMIGVEEPPIIPSEEEDCICEYDSVSETKKRWKIPTREELIERERQRTLNYAEWKEAFEDPEYFVKAYKDFRKLYFLEGIDRDELEEIVITFLNDREKVDIASDRGFVALCNALDEVENICSVSQEFNNKFR